MSNKEVRISHPELGRGSCMASALHRWLDKGWKLVEQGAGVEQTKVSGEGPAVEAPPALRLTPPLVEGSLPTSNQ